MEVGEAIATRRSVRGFLDTPVAPDMLHGLVTKAARMLFCGMAIGFEDAAEPANRLRAPRADEAEWLTVRS